MLEVGRIIKPHGLRGEVVVELSTNRLERVASGSVLYKNDSTRTEDRLVVVSSRPHQGRFLVTFDEVSGYDRAESLRNVILYAEPIVDDSALFVHELIGCELIDQDGVGHGLVQEVLANPASDVLLTDTGALCPVRFVVQRNADRLIVEAPEGLFS